MRSPDHGYLNELVAEAKKGSSNAFAEIYALTCRQQFAYSCRCLRDEAQAYEALRETYVRALRYIRELRSPLVLTAWLSRINFRFCRDRQGLSPEKTMKIGESIFSLEQIEELPVTEAMVTLMHFGQNMSTDEIGAILQISPSAVKQYRRLAQKHLEQLTFRAQSAAR